MYERLARKKLQKFLHKKFRLIRLAVIDANNWMAMILLPNGTSERYRCTNGTIVDELTIGD